MDHGDGPLSLWKLLYTVLCGSGISFVKFDKITPGDVIVMSLGLFILVWAWTLLIFKGQFVLQTGDNGVWKT